MGMVSLDTPVEYQQDSDSVVSEVTCNVLLGMDVPTAEYSPCIGITIDIVSVDRSVPV